MLLKAYCGGLAVMALVASLVWLKWGTDGLILAFWITILVGGALAFVFGRLIFPPERVEGDECCGRS